MRRLTTGVALIALLIIGGATTAAAQPIPEPTVTTTVNYVPVPGNPEAVDRSSTGTDVVPWATGWQFPKRSICIDGGWEPYFPYLDYAANDWRAASGGMLIMYVRKAIQGCAASGFVQSQRVFFRTYKADDGNCAYALTSSASGYVTKAEVFVNLQDGGNYPACRTTGPDGQYRWTGDHELGHSLGLAHNSDPSVMNVNVGTPRTTLPQESPVDGDRIRNIYGNNPQ